MPKLPYEWHQTDQEVVVSLLIKNILQETLEVDIQRRECHVSITLPTGAEIVFVLDPLLHDIDLERSSYQILPSRLNIHLTKLHRGQHWQYLDDGDQPEHIDPITIEPPSPSIVEDHIPVQIMSDLHLELFFPRREGIGVKPGYHVFDCTPSARILALLGDIGLTVHAGLYDFLERQLHKYRHILFVIGDHEGYESTYDHARAELQDFASRIRAQRLSDPTLGTFILLDRTRYDLTENVTILGCTLWSFVTKDAKGQGLQNFHRVQDWTVEDHNLAHAGDLEWLTTECAVIRAQEPHRRVVVFTHHAPTRHGTISPKYADSQITSAFGSELTTHPIWAAPISLWAFGHTHYNSDQVWNGIHVVSNQRGYDGIEASSSGFTADFVVQV